MKLESLVKFKENSKRGIREYFLFECLLLPAVLEHVVDSCFRTRQLLAVLREEKRIIRAELEEIERKERKRDEKG